METARLITGITVSVISVLCFVYISFTLRQKGPIFSNSYIFLTKEQREKADKAKEYRLVSVIFALLGVAFAFLGVYVFTYDKAFVIVCDITLCIAALYAIIDSF